MNNERGGRYLYLIIGSLALINVLIHLIFSYNLEYHRDELLYFSLGQHPAAGYATVPPMTGWIAWLMKSLFGYSLFAVRIFPALLGGIMVFLVSAIASELGGSAYARILAAVGIVVSILALRTFLMFQPVHIDLLFWTLLFYLIIRYINTCSDNYLLLIGIAAGAAILNKYLIGLLIALLVLIIPFTQYRHIFTRKKFWFGIIAGTLIIMPNLIWQAVNRFPVINHMAELERTQLVNVDRVSFLTEQLMIPGISSLLTVAGLVYLLVSRNAWKYRFLGTVVIGVVLSLMLLRGKSYYAQGIFPFLIAAGAVAWEKMLRNRLTRAVLIGILLLLTLPAIPIGLPVFRGERLVSYFNVLKKRYRMDFICRFEDNSIHSLPQDYADMLGWEELARIAADAWRMIPAKNSAFIYCENYGQAGAITVIGKKYDLPEAVSFHESFRYWIPEKFETDIKYALYINDELGEDISRIFGKITKAGSITDPHAREYGTGVWLCEDPLVNLNDFWEERLKHID